MDANSRRFEELISEAAAAPIEGWDFSWLDGRATEQRPSWHYSQLVAQRAVTASKMLDLDSGGGEMLSGIPKLPPLLVAAEGYMPNVLVAARNLRPRGAHVVATPADRPALPFAGDTFDLVTSRHPVVPWWDEIARVLAPGGTYLSQQVGSRSVRALSEFMLGPSSPSSVRDPQRARANAEAAGLAVQDLRSERLRMEFNDVGAVVYFLRLVIWIVPGFSVEGFRDRLLALHEQIEHDGPFVDYASRFLIRAAKPVETAVLAGSGP
jgi:SAM-dependent methyltransferase